MWSSNDESVVTVTELGEITAISEGTAEVCATFGEDVYICIVTVKSEVPQEDFPEDSTQKDSSDNNNQDTSGGITTEEDNTISEENISVSKIKISGISKKLAAGKKVKLTAIITPSNAFNKQVNWTTSNMKYATVTQSGKVKTKQTGKGKTVKIIAMATDGSGKKAVVRLKLK